VDELFAAKEIWITSTTKEIFPVTSINNSPINNGRCGDYWRTIEQYYRELIS